jgi:hypothetical protein
MASVIVELMSMENKWNHMDMGKKNFLSATSSTTNPIRTGLGLNNGLRVNGRLILGTALFLVTLINIHLHPNMLTAKKERRLYCCFVSKASLFIFVEMKCKYDGKALRL